MFSQTFEYALRAMIYLATQSPLEACPSGRIARAAGVPPRYLSKVMRDLVVGKLVDSSRGPKGGFTLRASPRDITLREIACALAPSRGRPDHARGMPIRPMHFAGRGTLGMLPTLERAIASTTLADVLLEQREHASDQERSPD